MKHIKFYLLLPMTLALGAAVPVTTDCDIPGNRLKIEKANTAEECASACNKNDSCKAFTFISGWGRCELKNQASKQFKIKIAAGTVKNGVKPRRMVSHGYGWDNTGKDFMQKKDALTLKSCESACLAHQRCQAYAFIEGYGSCWLKKNNGKKIAKVFYCGVKTNIQPHQ